MKMDKEKMSILIKEYSDEEKKQVAPIGEEAKEEITQMLNRLGVGVISIEDAVNYAAKTFTAGYVRAMRDHTPGCDE